MQNLKVIKDHKFKNIHISVRFLKSLKEEEVLVSMVLANMLNESCERFQKKDMLMQHLDSLYGAGYSATSNVIGNAQIINVKTKTIHPKYIHFDKNLLEEQFMLLEQFLFYPYKENGHLSLDKLAEAKRFLKEHLLRLDDDPSSYCMFEAMKVAGKDQPLGQGVNPSSEDVDAITLEQVERYYQEIMTCSQVDVLVFGDVDEKEVCSLNDQYLHFNEHTYTKVNVGYCLERKEMEQCNYETREMSQAYITSIYSTTISNKDEEFAALRVANAIFGQLPSSLLFQELREKRSLCYSIYSALYPYDGGLAVSTGVDKKNVKWALELIDEQFKRVQAGEFDDELVSVAQKMIVNSLKATYDDVDSILALEYRNILFDRKEDVNEVIQKIMQVSKEDVLQVMNKVKLITSFILQKGEADE